MFKIKKIIPVLIVLALLQHGCAKKETKFAQQNEKYPAFTFELKQIPWLKSYKKTIESLGEPPHQGTTASGDIYIDYSDKPFFLNTYTFRVNDEGARAKVLELHKNGADLLQSDQNELEFILANAELTSHMLVFDYYDVANDAYDSFLYYYNNLSKKYGKAKIDFYELANGDKLDYDINTESGLKTVIDRMEKREIDLAAFWEIDKTLLVMLEARYIDIIPDGEKNICVRVLSSYRQ